MLDILLPGFRYSEFRFEGDILRVHNTCVVQELSSCIVNRDMPVQGITIKARFQSILCMWPFV